MDWNQIPRFPLESTDIDEFLIIVSHSMSLDDYNMIYGGIM